MSYEESELSAFFAVCEEKKDLLNDIYVCVPARPHDGICTELAMALSMWFMVGIKWRPLHDSIGGFVEITRTKIAVDFLRNRSEKYLLMIDNDTAPPLDLPLLLSRHDKPIVGSCIVSQSKEGRQMLCFARQDITGSYRFPDFQDGDKIPATGLAPVPHCGTGAMLIRRDVLEAFEWGPVSECPHCEHVDWDIPFFIPEPIRARGAISGIVMQGEDIVFCKQARKRGFDVYVDLEAHCGHRKAMKMAFPESLRDPSMSVDDWVLQPKGVIVQPD